MPKEETRSDSTENGQGPRYKVRLPGLVPAGEMGPGDVIKRATYAIGINPCSSCERRATALNRWIGSSVRKLKKTNRLNLKEQGKKPHMEQSDMIEKS